MCWRRRSRGRLRHRQSAWRADRILGLLTYTSKCSIMLLTQYQAEYACLSVWKQPAKASIKVEEKGNDRVWNCHTLGCPHVTQSLLLDRPLLFITSTFYSSLLVSSSLKHDFHNL
jgi:hypothetical protein